ncbi:dihydrolipoyl dehydrogenase family protein [Epidermidibacterium keratini]|uniref:dihydrolipoyl dehydrogenase family protein n=1 Tax=Epidermidibacterium keratini TaxID=1891644 RepID=UPI001CEF8C58|nr:NAD(P)/FAD-dependent oxidoreductase [Epidermidibacterium keratini]
MSDEYDVIVLGGGPAGENAAQYAVRGSDRTAAIVEPELMGGECSYYACMPSKAMLRPIDTVATAHHLGGIAPLPEVEVEGVLKRRDQWVHNYDDSSQAKWAEDLGIKVVRGHGVVTGDREVRITGPDGETCTLRARLAVVDATGSEAVIPDEYATTMPWTSRDATGVRDIPGRLAIIGGGVVACEAAGWMSALGSTVTMLVRDPRLLGRTEEFAGELVADGLRDQGVEVRLGAQITGVRREKPAATGIGRVHGGPVTITVDGSEETFDEVLVAVGRRPHNNVELSGDDPDWLYRVGDASGEAPLTHWGKYRARIVGDEIAARAEGRAPATPPRDVPVPQVIFTDPQVAAVGMIASEARDAGIEIRVVDVPLSSAAGTALVRDDVIGQARLLIRSDDDTIIGATFAGHEVAELVHGATIAIVGKVPLDVLWHAVPSYPTASEIWLRLLEAARQT